MIENITLYHMRKAGGTSLRRYTQTLSHLRGLDRDALEGRSINHQTFFKNLHRGIYFTSLRDPIERIKSAYLYENRWFEKENKRFQGPLKPFNVWLSQGSAFPKNGVLWRCVSNYYTKALISYPKRGADGIGLEELELAKEVLSRFDIVLITEWMSQERTKNYLVRRLGYHQPLEHLNKNPHGQDTESHRFDENMLQQLSEDNIYDVQLYAFAKALFEKRIAQEEGLITKGNATKGDVTKGDAAKAQPTETETSDSINRNAAIKRETSL